MSCVRPSNLWCAAATNATDADGRTEDGGQEKWGRRRIRSRTLDGWTDGMLSARGCRSRWVGQSLSSFFRSVSISRCIRYSVIIGCFSASSESLRNMNYSWSKGFKITLSALLPQLECRSLRGTRHLKRYNLCNSGENQTATPHIEAKHVPFHMQYGSLIYLKGLTEKNEEGCWQRSARPHCAEQ